MGFRVLHTRPDFCFGRPDNDALERREGSGLAAPDSLEAAMHSGTTVSAERLT